MPDLRPIVQRFERPIRYVMVGAGVTLLYSLLALGVHASLIADATLASGAAFLATQPVAFLAHQAVTYPDAARLKHSGKRFFVTAAVGLLVTVGSMKLVDSSGLPFWIGLLIGWVFIPIANYTINAIWVFRVHRLFSLEKRKTAPPPTGPR